MRTALCVAALAAAGAVAASGPTHAECAALSNGCGGCMALAGCAFCAHDGDAASYIPEDLSGLWRFKQTSSRMAAAGAGVGEDHRTMLGAHGKHASKADARRPAATHGRMIQERPHHHAADAAFVEVGAAGEAKEQAAGFCFSRVEAERGVKPPASSTPALEDGSRWVCLDSREKVCDCDSAKDDLACSAPRSAVRLLAAGIFIAISLTIAAVGCIWASHIDVGAMFARSSRWGADGEASMAVPFKQDDAADAGSIP